MRGWNIDRRPGARRAPALLVGALTLLATLAWAAPAAAAPAARYASPTGAGSACTQVAPCDLAVAIGGAPAGATVKVRGDQGTYSRSIGIAATKAIKVVGTNGRPTIVFSSGGLSLDGGSIKNVSITANGTDPALSLDGGADATLVFAKAAGDSHGCAVMGGTVLTNVVCLATGAANRAIEIKGGVTLRNVTAYGGTESAIAIIGYDICGCQKFTVSIVNSILWAPSGTDIYVTSDQPDVTIRPTYSSYRTVNKVPEGTDLRVVSSPTNLTKTSQRPKFIAAGSDNLRMATKSPTINKGVNATANGKRDLDGRPRKVSTRTDIGAYEYSPPNTTITGGPSGTVTGDPAGFTFTSSRPGGTFECNVDGSPIWSTCSSPWDLGWTTGAHTFRVRATDTLGYVDPTPAKRTFTVTS